MNPLEPQFSEEVDLKPRHTAQLPDLSETRYGGHQRKDQDMSIASFDDDETEKRILERNPIESVELGH